MSEIQYDRNGREYRPATIGEHKHLVWSQSVDEDGETFDCELLAVDKLFDTPPVAKYHEEAQELRIQKATLRTEIRGLRTELHKLREDAACAEKSAGEQMARLKQHKTLARIEEFLAGEITHYVEYSDWGPPCIVALEDATCNCDDRCRDLRLLSLFGRTDGDLEWRLGRYSDGSGTSDNVFPCTSLDEAKAIATNRFITHQTKALDPNDKTTPTRRWLDAAKNCGTAMSTAYGEAVEAQERQDNDKRIANLEGNLRKLKG